MGKARRENCPCAGRPSIRRAFPPVRSCCADLQGRALSRRDLRGRPAREEDQAPSAAVAALVLVVPFRGRIVVQVLEEAVGQTDDLGSGVFAT